MCFFFLLLLASCSFLVLFGAKTAEEERKKERKTRELGLVGGLFALLLARHQSHRHQSLSKCPGWCGQLAQPTRHDNHATMGQRQHRGHLALRSVLFRAALEERTQCIACAHLSKGNFPYFQQKIDFDTPMFRMSTTRPKPSNVGQVGQCLEHPTTPSSVLAVTRTALELPRRKSSATCTRKKKGTKGNTVFVVRDLCVCVCVWFLVLRLS